MRTTHTAQTIEVNTAFILTKRETDPSDDRNMLTTLLGISVDEKEMVQLLVDKHLPKKMIGWVMRYHNWDQETYDTILKIVPALPTYDHYIVHKLEDTWLEEPEYQLTYKDFGVCGDDANEPDLTPLQREALYRLLGSSWYPSRHNEVHYEIEELALVPMMRKKGYGR
jgi:hypothetical protein